MKANDLHEEYEKYRTIIRDNFVDIKVNETPDTDAIKLLDSTYKSLGIKYFYKFMSLESKFTMPNLENNIFHISCIRDLNDMLECLFYINDAVNDDFSVDDKDELRMIKGKITTNINRIKNNTCLGSLTTTYNNRQMWGTYANSFSGICVQYDAAAIFDLFSYKLCPVLYSDEVVSKHIINFIMGDGATEKDYWQIDTEEKKKYKSLNGVREQLRFLLDVCTTKHTDWQSEREWRIVEIAMDRDDIDEEHGINKTNIVELKPLSIILGPKIKSEDKSKIIEIAKKKSIRVDTLVSIDNSYSLDIANIEI